MVERWRKVRIDGVVVWRHTKTRATLRRLSDGRWVILNPAATYRARVIVGATPEEALASTGWKCLTFQDGFPTRIGGEWR